MAAVLSLSCHQVSSLRTAILVTLLCPAVALCESAIKLAGLKAYLFNSRTGKLSEDVLAKDAPELGNVPAGKFGSVSTLVVVQVELGKDAALPGKTQVRLIAQETGSTRFAAEGGGKARPRILLDKTVSAGPVSEDGATSVGFWLDGTGCRTISLKAYLVKPRSTTPITAVLPFTCYE